MIDPNVHTVWENRKTYLKEYESDFLCILFRLVNKHHWVAPFRPWSRVQRSHHFVAFLGARIPSFAPYLCSFFWVTKPGNNYHIPSYKNTTFISMIFHDIPWKIHRQKCFYGSLVLWDDPRKNRMKVMVLPIRNDQNLFDENPPWKSSEFLPMKPQ